MYVIKYAEAATYFYLNCKSQINWHSHTEYNCKCVTRLTQSCQHSHTHIAAAVTRTCWETLINQSIQRARWACHWLSVFIRDLSTAGPEQSSVPLAVCARFSEELIYRQPISNWPVSTLMPGKTADTQMFSVQALTHNHACSIVVMLHAHPGKSACFSYRLNKVHLLYSPYVYFSTAQIYEWM